MNRECIWPFCGAEPDVCKCVFTPIDPDVAFAKKEVMPNDSGPFPETRTVTQPPVSEAGGEMQCGGEG